MPSGLLTVSCWGIQLQLTAVHYYCCQNCRDGTIWPPSPYPSPHTHIHPPPTPQPTPADRDRYFLPNLTSRLKSHTIKWCSCWYSFTATNISMVPPDPFPNWLQRKLRRQSGPDAAHRDIIIRDIIRDIVIQNVGSSCPLAKQSWVGGISCAVLRSLRTCSWKYSSRATFLDPLQPF